MLGAIDLDAFTDANTDILAAVAIVGAATVAAYVAARSFRFGIAWIGKLFKSGEKG